MSPSIAVLFCETGSIMDLELADGLYWLASGPQESVSASLSLGFHTNLTMPGFKNMAVGNPNVVLMLAQQVTSLTALRRS